MQQFPHVGLHRRPHHTARSRRVRVGQGSGAPATSTSPSTSTSTPAAVPVTVPPRTGDIGPTAAVELAPEPVEVAYGPDPMQKMDVYATKGEALGTIMYVHGGGWNGGSKDANTAPVILSTQGDLRNTVSPLLADVDETVGERLIFAQIQNGWDVVSIDYRLATPDAGPGIRVPLNLNDVDRVVRYTCAHAAELGLNMHRFVLTGGSAGGHLASMETEGAPTKAFADPTLPPELASTDPHIDATIAMVAPTDLSTFWQVGGIAPSASESLLGCTQDVIPAIVEMPPCSGTVVDDYSPLVWNAAARQRRPLPPAGLLRVRRRGHTGQDRDAGNAQHRRVGQGGRTRTHVGRPSPGRRPQHRRHRQLHRVQRVPRTRPCSGNWSVPPPK